MEVLSFLAPLATVVIALVGLFSGMGLIFNWLLSPIKENQARMEKRMDRIEKRMDRIESKLDQLIASQSPK